MLPCPLLSEHGLKSLLQESGLQLRYFPGNFAIVRVAPHASSVYNGFYNEKKGLHKVSWRWKHVDRL